VSSTDAPDPAIEGLESPADLSPSSLAALDALLEEAIADKDDFRVARLTAERGVFIDALTSGSVDDSWSNEEVKQALIRHKALAHAMGELRDQRSQGLGDCSRNAHAIQAYTGSMKENVSSKD